MLKQSRGFELHDSREKAMSYLLAKADMFQISSKICEDETIQKNQFRRKERIEEEQNTLTFAFWIFFVLISSSCFLSFGGL